MIDYLQETDSKTIFYFQEGETKIIFPLLEKFKVRLPCAHIDETIGADFVRHYLSLPESSSVVAQAWRDISKISHSEIAKGAKQILSALHIFFTELQLCGLELPAFPPFKILEDDDGSVIIEWRFQNSIIGFTIEIDADESGWFLVADEHLGNINAYGSISDMYLKKSRVIIAWLVSFALSQF